MIILFYFCLAAILARPGRRLRVETGFFFAFYFSVTQTFNFKSFSFSPSRQNVLPRLYVDLQVREQSHWPNELWAYVRLNWVFNSSQFHASLTNAECFSPSIFSHLVSRPKLIYWRTMLVPGHKLHLQTNAFTCSVRLVFFTFASHWLTFYIWRECDPKTHRNVVLFSTSEQHALGIAASASDNYFARCA